MKLKVSKLIPKSKNEVREWGRNGVRKRILTNFETQSIPEAGITGTVGTTYDSDGNPASLTYPDGRVLNYTYSARSQLKTVTPGGAAAVATYTYDTAGRPTQVTKANGANTAYGYNPTTGDLTSVLTTKAGQTVDGVTYTLDPANGRRTGITRSSNAAWTDTYGYDPAGQVTSGDYVGNSTLTDEDFVYDPTGNRTSHVQNGTATAYTPNALDQYSAIAGQTQGYDLNGNMTSFIPPAAGASAITMAWDGGNQLIGASRAAEGATEARNVLYRYDALGRRILKQVFDPSTSPPTLKTTTAFIYDGWNVIEERELTSSTKYRYTWGADVSGTHQGAGGVGGLLMAEATVGTGATEAHYYHYDGNGNVLALTNASGTREARYRYTAFGGNALTDAAPLSFGAVQPYRFSTKYLDREIEVREGMYYYGYRYYLTVIGRWLSRDPIWEDGGVNLFRMCKNGMTYHIDSDGRLVFFAIPAIPAIIGFGKLIADGVVAGVVAWGLFETGREIRKAIDEPRTPPATPAKPEAKPESKVDIKNPPVGIPGTEVECPDRFGNPKQRRRYGPDGYPETDTDYDHGHGQGKPHVHDWKPSPTGGYPERITPGRAPKPGDPGFPKPPTPTP